MAGRTKPARGETPVAKEQVWFLGIAMVSILCILFLLVRYVNTPLMLTGEQERPEPREMTVNPQFAPLPAANPQVAAAQIQPRITEKRFPAGLGSGQLQLIGQPTIPTGLGQQPMQFIGHPEIPVPAGIGEGDPVFLDTGL